MRKTLILPAALLVAAAAVAVAQQSGTPAKKPAAQPAPAAASQAGKPTSVQDRASYVIGYNLGRTLKQNDVQASVDLINKGLHDGLTGEKGMLTDEEMQATMQEFQKQVGAQQEAKQKALGEKNKTEGEAFLAKNKTRAGVKTTASGLQYEVLKEGTGPTPKPTDTVSVNYLGTTMDGTKFDSSYDRKEPATFVLNQVIPGWTEGVQLMKVGSKYKFYIPSALGYGEKGAGNVIGPNAPLVFEVELLSIGQPEAPKPAPAPAKPPTR
ncbi:MAG TPA: FKBP-type peptidyl-prolyl cis-trans isomerase [Thermoanaerobaculia bacterium]|jgi:FKBP-type peptidyl-prolyl cis-trans isomerase